MRSPLSVLLEVKEYSDDKFLPWRWAWWNFNNERMTFHSIGPFTFTYNRGHGECKNPVSNIESCTEDSRMLLSFQACPDVQGTESTGEPLSEQLTSHEKKCRLSCLSEPSPSIYPTSWGIDVLGGMERRQCTLLSRSRITQSRHIKRRAISMFRVRENQQ